MEQALEAMAVQVAAHHEFPAQVVQVTRQAHPHLKALTVVEALIPVHTPEQVAVVVVRQALRVALDQVQTPARVAQERHQALADRPLLTLAAVAVVLLKMEQALLVAREVAVLAETAVT